MINTERDVDVYLLGPVASGSLPMEMSGDALAAYGAPEAVQKFLVRFLTRSGSVVTHEEQGTNFLWQLTTGKLRTESEVTMAFNAAAHDTVLALAAESASDTDEDELPVDVRATDVTLTSDAVTVVASMSTAAGAILEFQLPFER